MLRFGDLQAKGNGMHGRYRMDFEDFERKVADNGVKLFLLCNPHNPVGRAWTRGELERVAEICERHGVIVASDEIHEDFARPGHEHVMYASVSESAARSCIVCTAPFKTFNLAGLQTSNVFIPDPGLRKRFKAEYRSGGLDEANAFGLVAAQAAYEHGADWLAQLKSYLEDNLTFVREFLGERLPELGLVEPESTYLLWIDCSALGLNDDELQHLIEDEAGLWLDMGTMFGEGESGFVHVNIACPRSTLEQAFAALARALSSRRDDSIPIPSRLTPPSARARPRSASSCCGARRGPCPRGPRLSRGRRSDSHPPRRGARSRAPAPPR